MMQMPENHSPHERDEAQVQRWFQALEPPQPFTPSPHFRDKVFADMEQRRDYRGWWARLTLWYASMEIRPGMRVALATGMILVLSVAVWWGIKELGPHQLDNGRTALSHQGDADVLWPTYQFQQKLMRAAAPSSLVSDDTLFETSREAYGFAPLPPRTLFFRLGTTYAQALALLQSNDRARGAQHVNHLVEALRQVQAPDELSAYLQALRAMLQDPQTDSTMLAQALAAFEPLYTAAYTKVDAEEGLTYFRFGTWVVNLSLAAAVGDQVVLQQGVVIEALRDTLAQHEAAPSVLDTLAQLHSLVTQPTLTDDEMRQVQTLVQHLQRIMRD